MLKFRNKKEIKKMNSIKSSTLNTLNSAIIIMKSLK